MYKRCFACNVTVLYVMLRFSVLLSLVPWHQLKKNKKKNNQKTMDARANSPKCKGQVLLKSDIFMCFFRIGHPRGAMNMFKGGMQDKSLCPLNSSR